MYKRAVHYLQGSEWVEIQCACPERVLNLLGARGIVFWDLTWESEICLRLRMLLRQEALLRVALAGLYDDLHGSDRLLFRHAE